MPQITISISTAAASKVIPVFRASGSTDAETWVKSLIRRECAQFYAHQAAGDSAASVQAALDAALAAVEVDFSST